MLQSFLGIPILTQPRGTSNAKCYYTCLTFPRKRHKKRFCLSTDGNSTHLPSFFRNHPEPTPTPELQIRAHTELAVPGVSNADLGSLIRLI